MRTGTMGLASPVRATLHQRRDLPRAPQFTMARACIWRLARNESPLASWRSVMLAAKLKLSGQNRGSAEVHYDGAHVLSRRENGVMGMVARAC
jgi:hypothetical protein